MTNREGPHSTLIASHRGGAELWAENSPTAFRNSADMPVDFVEFDVHRSADDALVVHHDATLDRMTNRSGAIRDMDWSDIEEAAIRGAGGEAPPLLADVVEIFRPTKIDLRVEIKLDVDGAPYPGIEADVAAMLVDRSMIERTVVSAFSLDTLRRFAAIETPGRGLIWLIAPLTLRHIGGIAAAIQLAQNAGVGEIAPRAPDMAEDIVVAARAAGLKIGAYAVNDAITIRKMLDLGIDAFTTDRPDLALAARGQPSPLAPAVTGA